MSHYCATPPFLHVVWRHTRSLPSAGGSPNRDSFGHITFCHCSSVHHLWLATHANRCSWWHCVYSGNSVWRQLPSTLEPTIVRIVHWEMCQARPVLKWAVICCTATLLFKILLRCQGHRGWLYGHIWSLGNHDTVIQLFKIPRGHSCPWNSCNNAEIQILIRRSSTIIRHSNGVRSQLHCLSHR